MGKYPAKIIIMKWIKNHNQRKQSGREDFMIKEQTTREKILESGKKWFLASGFKSAPLRKIVADAGFTQGAFYGYFHTKEDLFYALTDEFVEKTFTLLDLVLEEMQQLPPEQRLFEMGSCYRNRLPEIVSHFLSHREELRLILNCAEGTKYANLFSTLAMRNIRQLKTSLNVFFNLSSLDEKLMNILINGYFSMLGQIISEQKREEDMLQMMADIQKVYEKGIMGLFLDKKGSEKHEKEKK